VFGLIAVADTVRENSQAVVVALKQAGVAHIAMLTGDNAGAAASVASGLGLDASMSGLLPEEKVAEVGKLVDQYQHVAMVGDGINDAPALSAASIGISMGAAGSDAALEAADMALMADDLDGIAYAIRLGRRTLTIIRQNVWFAVGIKLVFVLLTLYGLSNLWMAVFADTGAAILVTLNSMRLMRE
jgi:Cd2+/Zn2+-exporting ATPase